MLIKTGYTNLLDGCDFLSFRFDELLRSLRKWFEKCFVLMCYSYQLTEDDVKSMEDLLPVDLIVLGCY